MKEGHERVKITGSTVKFSEWDIPSRESLFKHAVYAGFSNEEVEEFIADVPAGEFKKSTSEHVAALYLAKMNDGVTFNDLGTPKENAYFSGKSLSDPKVRFYAQLSRFMEYDNDSAYLYFQNDKELSSERSDYYASLKASFEENQVLAIASSLNTGKEMLIEPGLLTAAFELQRNLTEEGVILPFSEISICASFWNYADVVNLLENRVPLMEAIELSLKGVERPDDIIRFRSNIPSDWLDALFSDDDDFLNV